MSAAPDISVRGAEDFLALSKRLKAAGRGDLRKQLNKALRDSAKPLLAETRAALRRDMPSRNGLGDFLARKPARIAVKTGSNPGVSVIFGKTDPRLDAQGRLAHPVYGVIRTRTPPIGRRVVAVQRVKAGVFSGALQSGAPTVQGQLVEVIGVFIRRAVLEGVD